MRKKNVAKWMVVLATLVAVSTSLIAGTLAKYSSEFAGSDTALVAKWELTTAAGQLEEIDTGKDVIMDGSGVTNLDLFQHEYDQHVRQMDEGEEKFIIAPGVEGNFFLILMNKSDVAAEIDLAFAKLQGSAGVPLEYNVLDLVFKEKQEGEGEYEIDEAYDNDVWVPLEDLAGAIVAQVENAVEDERHVAEFARVDVIEGNKQIVLLPNDNHEKNILQIIRWRWPFDTEDNDGANDERDTGLGIDSANMAKTQGTRTSYGIRIDVTATQAQPGITQQP